MNLISTIFSTLKTYTYAAFALLGTVVVGVLIYLKKSNEAKAEKIDELEKEILVKDEIHKSEKDVAEFKGSLNVLDEALKTKQDQADIEYKKAVENEKINNTSNDNYTML